MPTRDLLPRESPPRSRRGVGRRGSRGVLLAVTLLILSASAAPAAEEVTGYDPSRMDTGAVTEVTIQGQGFGREQRDRCVRYGQGAQRSGSATVLSWAADAVRVRMLGNIAPGTYWIAIFGTSRGSCVDPRSNYLETFVVRERGPVFPDAGGGRGVGRRDLAIVGVLPGIGTTVTPTQGRIDATIRVRNAGAQAETFALTDGRPRVRRGPLGGQIREGIETTPSTRLAPGAEVEIPMSFPVGGDQDAFTRRRVWIVSPGAMPVPFMDGNGRNNEATVWYRLQASAYRVTATLERIRITDDCDNVSPGDWIVSFSGSAADHPRNHVVADRWPARGASNVSSGTTVDVGRTITLRGIGAGEDVLLTVSALDCDTGVGGPGEHLVELFGDFQGRCSDQEEVQEVSGAPDLPGTVRLRLRPAQWKAGGVFERHSEEPRDCTYSAYHAVFRVNAVSDF